MRRPKSAASSERMHRLMTHTVRRRGAAAAVVAAALLMVRCASAPPAPVAPAISLDKKMAAILQLEDQRILRIELPPPPVVAPPARRGRAAATPPPPFAPDLTVLVTDTEPRVRRRAALAIGRVGLREGVQPLIGVLADPDPDVRAMGAFALGLIGDGSAVPPLVAALRDTAPLVAGRAAEALGLINAKDAAGSIGEMAAQYGRSPAVAAMQGDDESMPVAPEAEAFRLGIYALVRLRAYEPLAAATLAGGAPVTSWWPVAYALQRINDARALPSLRQMLGSPGKYTAAFAARGIGALKDAASLDALAALVDAARTPLEVRVSAVRAIGQIGDARGGAALARLLSQPSLDPQPRARSGGGRRHAQGGRGPADRAGPADRPVADDADRGAAGRGRDRPGELRPGALEPRSGSAVERARGAGRRARHAAGASRARASPGHGPGRGQARAALRGARAGAAACARGRGARAGAPQGAGFRRAREHGGAGRPAQARGGRRGAARGVSRGAAGFRLRGARGRVDGARGVRRGRGDRHAEDGSRRQGLGRAAAGRGAPRQAGAGR